MVQMTIPKARLIARIDRIKYEETKPHKYRVHTFVCMIKLQPAAKH